MPLPVGRAGFVLLDFSTLDPQRWLRSARRRGQFRETGCRFGRWLRLSRLAWGVNRLPIRQMASFVAFLKCAGMHSYKVTGSRSHTHHAVIALGYPPKPSTYHPQISKSLIPWTQTRLDDSFFCIHEVMEKSIGECYLERDRLRFSDDRIVKDANILLDVASLQLIRPFTPEISRAVQGLVTVSGVPGFPARPHAATAPLCGSTRRGRAGPGPRECSRFARWAKEDQATDPTR